VLNIFGSVLAWFALYFALPIVVALLYGEFQALRGFVAGGLIAAAVGLALQFTTRRYRHDLKPRDAFLLASAGWLTIAAVATAPLLIDLPGMSFTHAYFETMSGLSTTGATMLHGIDRL